MALEYRNTFIAVKEEFGEAARAARAQSSPPGRTRRSSFSMESQDQEEARSYVSSLAQNAAQLGKPGVPQVLEDSETSPVTPAMDVHAALTAPSLGSRGHPDVCRRPCIYFTTGHCGNGQACAYCHLTHEKSMPKLDKRQRILVQHLSRPQLMSMALHFCRTQAEQRGFTDQVQEILALLEAGASGSASSAESGDAVTDRDIRNLRKTLARMSFSSLIGLVAHLPPKQTGAEHEAQVSARLLAALEDLRLQLPVSEETV
ncbi:unnamed protein product [Symbiodinium natans]|uniref:C3H1-type domain-containing protein n=1 Tax=Symbiodinium natans TaxID=878477 RepID=A0A812GYT5_9DINO|nr:unnamed protein product [Symbiodinium natans]